MPIGLSSVINSCPVHPFSDFQHFLYVTGRKCLRIGRQLFFFKKRVSAHAAHLRFTLSVQLISFSTFPSLAFPDHPPTTNHHQQACQHFAWAVNLIFLVQIHFSCLGTITKQFLSTDLAPCANMSRDQAHNEMFWMKLPHIKTEIYTHAHIPFYFHICICQLKSNITFEMLQKTKSVPAFKQSRMHQSI